MLYSRTSANIVLLFILTAFVIWLFTDIVIYILVSLVISTILRPVTDYLDNIELFGIGVPRILAVFFSFVILAFIPVLFVLLFAPLIIEQVKVLQSLSYQEILLKIKEPIDMLEAFILNNFPTDRKNGFILKEINQATINFVAGLNFGSVLNYLLRFTGKIFFYLIAISFITFFFLYEKGMIRRSLLALVPNQYFEVVITTVYKIEKLLSNYLIGLLIQVTIFFTLISLGLSILGIKYALTIAAFAAFINLIPYLGPVMGFIFAIFVVFSTNSLDNTFNANLINTFAVVPVFAATIFFDNLFVQPYIFSKSVKAHPLEIFIAIFAGATLAGPLGMIAAIPVYTTFRVSFIELSTGYRQYRVFKPQFEQPHLPKGNFQRKGTA